MTKLKLVAKWGDREAGEGRGLVWKTATGQLENALSAVGNDPEEAAKEREALSEAAKKLDAVALPEETLLFVVTSSKDGADVYQFDSVEAVIELCIDEIFGDDDARDDDGNLIGTIRDNDRKDAVAETRAFRPTSWDFWGTEFLTLGELKTAVRFDREGE